MCFFPGPLRVSPAPDGSWEVRWRGPVGAEYGEGEAERKQLTGILALHLANQSVRVEVCVGM